MPKHSKQTNRLKCCQNESHSVASREMCFYCFDVLSCHLNDMDPPLPPELPKDHFPLFISWHLEKEKKLRGCQGTFAPQPLDQGLRHYALKSAFNDPRFPSVAKSELAYLMVSVSVLKDFEPARDYRDWEIGDHGIKIEFNDEDGTKRSATYLPHVAAREGWTIDDTMESLIAKSGYTGPVTQELKNRIQVTRYKSEKVSLNHKDYVTYWKNWPR